MNENIGIVIGFMLLGILCLLIIYSLVLIIKESVVSINNSKKMKRQSIINDEVDFRIHIKDNKSDYEKMQELAKKVLEENRVKVEKESKEKELLEWARIIVKDKGV